MVRSMTDRCTGHCCRRFTLPFTPTGILQRRSQMEDGDLVADMVIPIGFSCDAPSGEVLGEPCWWYTCCHLLPSGDCAIYESRPEVCRSYPYGSPCKYPGCTWAAARAGTAPNPRAKESTTCSGSSSTTA